MAQAAKSPATNEQLINIGIIILQHLGVFTEDIRNWIKRPAQEHNWSTFQEHLRKSQLELELAQLTANSMGFHNQYANSADAIVNKLYEKISVDTSAPAAYYDKSESAAATHMNQHTQQLAQATQQNTHMQNVLQNLTSQVANLQNQLNNAPQPIQQTPVYQHQAYPFLTHAPATYHKPPPAPYQTNNQAPYHQQAPYQPQNQNQQYQPYHKPQWNDCNGRRGEIGIRGGRRGHQQPREKRYCWTHGFCTHNISECRQPTMNQQYTATTTNTMDENTSGCYWVAK